MNRLALATSPYLLQHAHNPVDWFAWGEEAFAKAKKENKPVLVSIGYSSCHWCHVMEHQSFEDVDVAAVMNEFLVCIKVDREERPDIDHIYMDAVQAMGMNGGWPLNVFVTPEGKPFYGGTYFPPTQWVALIRNLNTAWKSKKDEILDSANGLTEHLQKLDNLSKQSSQTEDVNFREMETKLAERFDWEYGGTAGAPKFIMPSVWGLLLRLGHINKSQAATAMVVKTLEKTAAGGIFDQLAGGFARYSVDEKWFAPHFEKMLFDNGQLLSLFSEAFAKTQVPKFKAVIDRTLAWIETEMTHPEGGFYSAIDADSEGVEGKYYVWTQDDITHACGQHSELIMEWFGCEPNGNWEHGTNILTSHHLLDAFAIRKKIPVRELEQLIEELSAKLLNIRRTRIAPALDDKILLGWNCITICGLVDASKFAHHPKALEMAETAMRYVEANMLQEKAIRSFRQVPSPTEAFLEDYAYLIQAYIYLYQATFNEEYLMSAKKWCAYTINHFFDTKDGFFHFAGAHAEKLITNKKEIVDNVIPASNSVMARNLLRLAVYFNVPEWHSIAEAMILKLALNATQEPGYFSNWALAANELKSGFVEVVIAGPNFRDFARNFQTKFLPQVLFAGASTKSNLPLLHNRIPSDGATTIYVCHKGTCKLPVSKVEEALELIEH